MNQHIVAFLVSLAVLALGNTAIARDARTAELTTQRHVQGIITQAEPTIVTISGAQRREVIGHIDPKRTRITVDGRPASAAALQVSYRAHGEIGLDDVWCQIDAQAR